MLSEADMEDKGTFEWQIACLAPRWYTADHPMIHTAIQNSFVPPHEVVSTANRSIWQRCSASGEAIWTWVTWAFTAYWILFVAGAFLHHKELNVAGGVVVLGVLALMTLERLWVRMDGVVIASLLAATCLPLLQSLVSAAPTPDALFKHVSLCMVIAIARLIHLPAACRTRMRGLLAAQVLVILLISVTIFKGSSWDGGTRHSGLFVNPNNLALIPFLLLFFVDMRRDSRAVLVSAHGVVVAVLAFSATSGAVLAYAIGLGIHFSNMVSKKSRSILFLGAAVASVATVVVFAAGGERFLPQTRLINQISVMGGQLKDVVNGTNIAYYEKEKVLGSGSASGIWRLMHWRKTIVTYFDGTLPQQLFGFGIGSSPRILGVLPHNEYLRMLFEQGLVGFSLFIFVWKRLIWGASTEIRYVGVITAIYSFSENNLDNFPFMALLILCLSATCREDQKAARNVHLIRQFKYKGDLNRLASLAR